SVGIREAKDGRAQIVNAMVEEVVILRGQLIDPVDVDRIDRMCFVDRQIPGTSVHLPRRGIDQDGARVLSAASLDQLHGRRAIYGYVEPRISHAVAMADLSSEMENEILSPSQMAQRRIVPHVRHDDMDAIFEALQVIKVPTVLWDERVDD